MFLCYFDIKGMFGSMSNINLTLVMSHFVLLGKCLNVDYAQLDKCSRVYVD
jgi:hypothetical protein